MTVLRLTAALCALAALSFSAGCGGNSNVVTTDETGDLVYQQAQDFKKQGRYNEALNGFLKEIDRRGENGAPESHLEAGALYLNWSHNPVEAYHHFSKYLELQPTGPRASIVRGQRDAAMREIARYLLAPASGQGVAAEHTEDVEQLRRQIEELKAENQTLRGATSVPVTRAAPLIALPADNATSNAASDTEITPVETAPPNQPTTFTHNLAAPVPATSRRAAPPAASPGRVPVIGSAAEAGAFTPTRPSNAARPAAAARRSHTVKAGEKSLWGIARHYYGSVTQARVTAIYEANRDVMRSANDLRPGMVLRIP